MSPPPTSIRRHRMSGAAAGPGTPARPVGSIAPASKSILGLAVKGDALQLNPCIPAAWPGFAMTLRYRGAVYEISVRNPAGVSRGVAAALLDGVPQPLSNGTARLELSKRPGAHAITITLGETPQVPAAPQTASCRRQARRPEAHHPRSVARPAGPTSSSRSRRAARRLRTLTRQPSGLVRKSSTGDGWISAMNPVAAVVAKVEAM
jgi:hypothetical protein